MRDEQQKIVDKCFSKGCKSEDYKRLNELEGQITEKEKQISPEGRSVGKSLSEIIVEIFKKIIKKCP